ncbi:hypothetical protein CcaverHIS002_0300300 [Cutaneotrichosporon cavernicola]|nr:hypothetical protein CcaverHIS002_0300300 [Cutaneotrichosporon cavernicola]
MASLPGTPYSFGSEEGTNAKLQHLATQFVTHTVTSRAQLKALGEEVSQIFKWQEEVAVLARAEEARRQNRAISSLAALEKMSDSDLANWYAYYSSTAPPTVARDALIAALATEVGLSQLPPLHLFLKWTAVLCVLVAILALSVINRDNGALQSILQQIVQIIGQYLLKTSLFVQNASIKLIAGAEAWGSALQATRIGTVRIDKPTLGSIKAFVGR